MANPEPTPRPARITQGSKQREVRRGRAGVGWTQHMVEESKSVSQESNGALSSPSSVPHLMQDLARMVPVSQAPALGVGEGKALRSIEVSGVSPAFLDTARGADVDKISGTVPQMQELGTNGDAGRGAVVDRENALGAADSAQSRYHVPDYLQGFVVAMGGESWADYLDLVGEYVDGLLDVAELERRERTLFQVQDERIRRRIRGAMVKMIKEGK